MTRPQWQFFRTLFRVHRSLVAAWWGLILTRGALPALFAVLVGVVVDAVRRNSGLAGPLTALGLVFIAMQTLAPLHTQLGANLGERFSSWLHDRLLIASVGPAGIAHLESPELAGDLALARDFDLGISDPPLSLSMSLIAGGLVELVAGAAQVVVLAGFRWWAPFLVGGAWASTHWLLRESSMWDRDTGEVREAQRIAEYNYRLAVDAPAAKEIRIFGLAGWTVQRFSRYRTRLVDLRWQATRLQHKPMWRVLALLVAANALFFWALARAADGIGTGAVVTYAQAAVGASALAFGGLNWALPLAADGVAAVLRFEKATAAVGRLPETTRPADDLPRATIRFRDVEFRYGDRTVLNGLDLTVPAGTSLAVVGQNGAGKTTLAKLLCRLYDPTAGTIEIDGVDLREFDVGSWRRRIAAVFQDFLRYELPLRDNVAPLGATEAQLDKALVAAGVRASPDAILAAGYAGGTDLSGGQWQRVALARALCTVDLGAGVVILDEPTAALDVRGEAEIFDRILEATRGRTTILISHRFSTVRLADRICVLENGKVAELGTHDELMALQGRYQRMFDIQAARFEGDLDE